MRILYHHRTQGQGAEGVHIREVITALRTLGHTVDIVSPPGCDPYRAEKQKGSGSKGIPLWKKFFYAMPQICFEILEILYNLRARAALKKQTLEQTYDAIYERYSFFGVSGIQTAKKLQIPLILEVNEISGIKRQRKQVLVQTCSRWEKRIFQKADALIVVSDFLKNEIASRGIDPQKIHVIPNAVNIHDFHPDQNSKAIRASIAKEDQVIITFVGMFSHWDRLDWLIDIFKNVLAQAPQAHLLIIGEGVQKNDLIKKAATLGLSRNITFTGLVPRKEIPVYLDASDIGTLSGSNPFGSPIAMFESMIMKNPVVVPAYDPTEAIIKDGINGFLFPPDDAETYTQKLIKLVQDADLRCRMGKAAQETILKNHLWTHNAQHVVDIYRTLKTDGHS